MGKLSKKLRAKWDRIIETEGARLGLSECRAFLEGKTVNDVFYEGKFKGQPCIVKCSSKAPDSIENEYEMTRRLYELNQDVFCRPLAFYATGDGKMAFVAIEKISVRENVANSSLEEDVMAMSRALESADVVHRDIFMDNLLLGADGHYKLVDLQFAVDRKCFRECDWMRRNWKYRYVVFGVNRDLPRGCWNDFLAFADLLEKNAGTLSAGSAEMLRRKAAGMSVCDLPDGKTRFRLWLYKWSLRAQIKVHGRNPEKVGRLTRRLEVLTKI